MQKPKNRRMFLKRRNTEIVKSDEYFAELPQIAWHFDEPVAIRRRRFIFARETSKHVKAVLSGEELTSLSIRYLLVSHSLAKFNRVLKVLRSLILLSHAPINAGIHFCADIRKNLRKDIRNAHIFSTKEAGNLEREAGARMNLDTLLSPSKKLFRFREVQFIDINTWLPGIFGKSGQDDDGAFFELQCRSRIKGRHLIALFRRP